MKVSLGLNKTFIVLGLVMALGVGHWVFGAGGAPRRGTEFSPSRVLAFADVNNGKNDFGSFPQMYQALQARRRELGSSNTLVLGGGDYVHGEYSDFNITQMLRDFLARFMLPLGRTNFALTPGNHDALLSRDRAIYKTELLREKAQLNFVDGESYPFYYSFVRDGVFYASLDDVQYNQLINRDTQLAWLRKQLRSEIAQQAQYRVVMGHIPLYSVAATSSGDVYSNGHLVGERRRASGGSSLNLETLLREEVSRVDLVVFAHSHAFYVGQYVYEDSVSELKDKLNVVSLPCAGSAPRYLRDGAKSSRAFSEIEFADRFIGVSFRDQSNRVLSLESLPRRLTLEAGRVTYVKADRF